MDILHLTLKKKWFDMIASGEKKEEYRSIKPYWNTRLSRKAYDAIKFRNGYNQTSPTFLIELKNVTTGLGMVEWGAPAGKEVYILKLGNIIEATQYADNDMSMNAEAAVIDLQAAVEKAKEQEKR